jgi:Cu/Ag efflux pump CusA
MPENYTITAVAHVIQLAVAPVFLLTGIGAMLAVLTNRLARIVDRARVLEANPHVDAGAAGPAEIELSTLSQRAKLINRAITLCTITALLVSGVIAILFLAAFVVFEAAAAVAVLFVTAMSCFIAALVYFLREIFLATASLRIGRH